MEPLISLSAGDPIVAPLLGVYLASLGESVTLLRAAVTTRAFSEIKRLCHKARGSAATYGFPPVVACLASFEAAAQSGAEFETLTGHLSTLESLRDRVALGVPKR